MTGHGSTQHTTAQPIQHAYQLYPRTFNKSSQPCTRRPVPIQVSNFVLAIVAFPYIAAAIAPALVALWFLRTQYVHASAQAQRLEASSRAPVLARMRAMVEVRGCEGVKYQVQ